MKGVLPVQKRAVHRHITLTHQHPRFTGFLTIFSSEAESLFLVMIFSYPLLRAVMIQSAQKRCKHSFVVMVFFNISKQMGHISSLCRLLGDTTISKPSVIAS